MQIILEISLRLTKVKIMTSILHHRSYHDCNRSLGRIMCNVNGTFFILAAPTARISGETFTHNPHDAGTYLANSLTNVNERLQGITRPLDIVKLHSSSEYDAAAKLLSPLKRLLATRAVRLCFYDHNCMHRSPDVTELSSTTC